MNMIYIYNKEEKLALTGLNHIYYFTPVHFCTLLYIVLFEICVCSGFGNAIKWYI